MIDEQTRELIAYRLERAKKTLQTARVLYDINDNLSAANRIYYACFYAVLAALLLEKQSAKSHSGIRAMFHRSFILSGKIPRELGKFYNEVFDIRHEDDYDDFADIGQELTSELLNKGEDFIKALENLIDEELAQTDE